MKGILTAECVLGGGRDQHPASGFVSQRETRHRAEEETRPQPARGTQAEPQQELARCPDLQRVRIHQASPCSITHVEPQLSGVASGPRPAEGRHVGGGVDRHQTFHIEEVELRPSHHVPPCTNLPTVNSLLLHYVSVQTLEPKFL